MLILPLFNETPLLVAAEELFGPSFNLFFFLAEGPTSPVFEAQAEIQQLIEEL